MHLMPDAHHHDHSPRRPIRWGGLLAWAVAAWIATGLYVVRPNERALVQRCGRALERLEPPGLHFGFPARIDRVTRLRLSERKREPIGATLASRALGREGEPRRAEQITGDRNLILASAVVQYEIADAKRYRFGAADCSAVVRALCSAALAEEISGTAVDDVLTVERSAIQASVLRRAQAELDRCAVGVRLTAVSFDGVAPPAEVADSFRDVTSAREDRQRAVQEARGYASRLLPRARGEAESVRLAGEGAAEAVLRRSEGEAGRFTRIVAEVPSSGTRRRLALRRLLLESLERVLPRLRKVVLEPESARALDLDLIESGAGATGAGTGGGTGGGTAAGGRP